MTCAALLAGIRYTGSPPQGEVSLVTQDSRKVAPGAVFVCVKGRSFDGHTWARQALAAGAVMVVTQRPLGLSGEVTVADTRAAYALLCANFFGRPAQKLTLVGVTGTNGKTSVTTILKGLLGAMGVKCGLIGTALTEIDGVEIPARFTTPEAWDLHALFARMVAAGCTHVVMEASSQALEQGRLHGLCFRLAVFTNLTRDHLDYHGSMESYLAAKRILFTQSQALLANLDDETGAALLAQSGTPAHSFSAAGREADFSARDVRLSAGGVRFALLHGTSLLPVSLAMPGEYSVSNALAAVGGAVLLGFPLDKAAAALKAVPGVPGRCEVLYSGAFTILTDFAHTDDALRSLLAGLAPFAQNRLVVLFGPAGDRDGAKRPGMAAAADAYGDEVFLTADNPRTESLEAIFAQTAPPATPRAKWHRVEDRAAALSAALETLAEGDMLVLCGKGHEDYQVQNGYTEYFSEREQVRAWLCEKGLA